MLRSRVPVLLLLLLCLAPACGQDARDPLPGHEHASGPKLSLPALGDLPPALRSSSDTATYDLFLNPPVLSSGPESAVLNSHGVTLAPPEGSIAWAVYSLAGFELAPGSRPIGIYHEATGPLWIGISDYEGLRWQLFERGLPYSGLLDLSGELDSVSPSGFCYVVVLAHEFTATVGTLNIILSEALPGGLASEIEDNDGTEEANPLTLPVSGFSGHVGQGGYDGDSNDYFVFSAAEGQRVELELNYDQSQGNLSLGLLDPETFTYYTDNDGNPGTRSFSWGLRGGDNFIRVSRQTGASTYTLNVALSTPGYGEVEDNDSTAEATPLTQLPVINLLGSVGDFSYDGDNNDYFVFEAQEGHELELLLLYEAAEANISVALLDSDGFTIHSDTQGNLGLRSFDWGLHAGPNYVRVSRVTGAADYNLHISLTDAGYDEVEDNDGTGEATAISAPMTDWHGHVGDFGYDGDNHDYLLINASDGELYAFDLTYVSSLGNLTLSLLDSDGFTIHSENTSNTGSRVFSWGTRGEPYYLRVTAASGHSDYYLDMSSTVPGYDETESNDDTGSADELPALPFSNWFGNAGEEGYDGSQFDVGFIELAAPATLDLHLSYDTSGGDANLSLSLLDEDGFTIESDTSGNTGERQITEAVAAGLYHVRVRAVSGVSDYLLSASTS